MRRIGSNRSYKTSRNSSPSDSFNGSSFRKTQRTRGRSSMRRTEISWEKLQKMPNDKDQNIPSQKQKINDYLLTNQTARQPKNNQQQPRNQHPSRNGNPTIRDRIQFLRNSKQHKINGNTELSARKFEMKKRLQTKKLGGQATGIYNRILTVKSLKSLNTTDSNNKRESPVDSGQSQAYASFYQMNAILENACERQRSRQNDIYNINNCKTIPQQDSNQEYQLFTKNQQSNKNDHPSRDKKKSGRGIYQLSQKPENGPHNYFPQASRSRNRYFIGSPINKPESKHEPSELKSNPSRKSLSRNKNKSRPLSRSKEMKQSSRDQKNKYKHQQQESMDYYNLKQKRPTLQKHTNQQNLKQSKQIETKKVSSLKKCTLATDLPLYSRHNSIILNSSTLLNLSTVQNNCSTTQNTLSRISVHLEILSEIAEYCKSMIEMYEELDDWEQLIFLMYKKYYIQRLKVLNILKSTMSTTQTQEIQPPKNPFVLSSCKVSISQLFLLPKKKKNQLLKIIQQIQKQNKLIWDSMRNFYNIIIDKSGNPYINLDRFEDNFNKQIFEDVNTELSLLEDISGAIASKSVQKRLKQIYKTVFLISELDNKFIIGYEESLEDNDDEDNYVSRAKFIFKKFWHYLNA